MSSSDRKENLFAQALLLSESEWPAFLDRECKGDPALRQRLEALLKAHQAAGQFIDTPAPAAATRTAVPPSVEREGTRIGRYKLLQKIGEGGCGVVWMAEQEEDVRRQVAIKIIKIGMDTREVITRFEAERQAMALMDHPNIAKILDAGSTDSGRPYFVMELVRGIKITEFCDKYGLSTGQRLDLFLQVCNGVQHAHQKGIIHRDLKPSNVLVTLSDNQPVAKVIDFGIAKATTGRLTDHTLFTAFEQFMGTPAYMSPEQAELSAVDIDTRSDIYSLGVLLYELLTGRLPFDPKTLLQAGLDEIRRIIREVEPPRPSTHLSTLGADARAKVAQLRNTDPAKLSLLLRGDLDWIIMRCLEKNRTRRYATTNALAADITRHIHHEPVVARPASRLYKFGRFIRRHRVVSAALAAVALALVAGTIVSTWQAVRARRAEQRAVAARQHADHLLRLFMLGDLYDQLNKVGKVALLESTVDKANAYLASLGPGDQTDTTEFSQARVFRVQSAVRAAQGRYAEATSLLERSYTMSSRFAAAHPNDLEALYERGEAESQTSGLYWFKADYPAAIEWGTRFRDTAIALVAHNPANRDWQMELFVARYNLAYFYKDLGQLDAAQSELNAALASLDQFISSAPDDLDLRLKAATTHELLGLIAELQGNFPAAARHYELRVTQLARLVADDSKNAITRLDLANARVQAAKCALITGRLAEAEPSLALANNEFDALRAVDDQNVYLQECSLLSRITAVHLVQRGDQVAALEVINAVITDLAAIAAKAAPDRLCLQLLSQAWRLKAGIQLLTGSTDALDSARQSVAFGEKLIVKGGSHGREFAECARDYLMLGRILAQAGDHVRAHAAWLRARDLLAPHQSGSADWAILDPYARSLALLGQETDARAIIDRLQGFGYFPLEPWPSPAGPPTASSSAKHHP